MTLLLVSIVFLALLLFWSGSLIFYRERARKKLISDESKCFSPRCKSIIYENGNKKAVLFIHGFPTTPHMYEYPTKVFSDAGYDVFSPLIPTFGANYKEFEETNFSEWFNFIDEYYLDLKNRYSDVYIVGLSMGGAMTLKLAEKYSSTSLSPKRIAVLSAPVAYNSPIRDGFVTDWATYLGRFLALFIKDIGAKYVDGKEDGEDGNENWVGYGGTFLRQGVSLIYNLKSIRRDLSKITLPMISIHDKGDKTVPFGNQKIIIENVKSSPLEVISTQMGKFNHTHHSLLMYNSTKEECTKSILAFFSKEEG